MAAAAETFAWSSKLSHGIPPEGRVVVQWEGRFVNVELKRGPSISFLFKRQIIELTYLCSDRQKVELPCWTINGTHFVFSSFEHRANDDHHILHLPLFDRAHLVVVDEWGSDRNYSVSNRSGDIILLAPQIATTYRRHQLSTDGKVVQVGRHIAPSSPITVNAPKGHVRSKVDEQVVDAIRGLFKSSLDQNEDFKERCDLLLRGLAACFHASQTPDGSGAPREYELAKMLEFFGIPHTPSEEA